MSRWRWVLHDGQRLTDIGVTPDGALHNPNGYDESLVRAAVAHAEARRHVRRSRAAFKAAATRARRVERRVYQIVTILRVDGRLTPSPTCTICGKALDDAESLARGIGSDCWQRVLAALAE